MDQRKAGRGRGDKPVAEVRTLERGLLLLQALGQSGPVSLSELARLTKLSPSTAYRLLETLRRHGFVAWDGNFWRVGLRCYQVGLSFVARGGLLEAAPPQMRQLVAQVGESVNLAVLDGSEAVYVHQVEGHHLVRMFTHLGGRVPLHCSGVGKVLLAWCAPDEAKKLLGEGPYTAFTPKTLTQWSTLEAELSKIRQQGYALDDEEREAGVRCIAAPIQDRSGVVGAISLSAPVLRLPLNALHQVVPLVLETARRISAGLGAL